MSLQVKAAVAVLIRSYTDQKRYYSGYEDCQAAITDILRFLAEGSSLSETEFVAAIERMKMRIDALQLSKDARRFYEAFWHECALLLQFALQIAQLGNWPATDPSGGEASFSLQNSFFPERSYHPRFLHYLYSLITQDWNLGGYGVFDAIHIPPEIVGYSKWELRASLDSPPLLAYLPDIAYATLFRDDEMYSRNSTSPVDYKNYSEH